jgi:hypothetical protein
MQGSSICNRKNSKFAVNGLIRRKMKQISTHFLFFLLFLFTSLQVSAQADQKVPDIEPVALTPQQLYSLSSLPPLSVPEIYKGADAPLLPWWIDNSTQPYFRPITSQTGFECGQSAGIAFNFTYEIDRLRSVPANTAANQYPTHFAWDFLNNGDNYTGASCFDSWEIVRSCGTMNVLDYGGGLNTGGYLRWITGYDKYYNGMQNRINYMRSIRCDYPEGLQILKYWLYDHLEGSAIGGVANFYGNYFSPVNVLPAGTPEAGKYVQTAWGPSPSHTWTICGFNDSIRYDYNNDGLYTNTIDINGDGKVDMHDWEIGGLKFANGYAGTGWGNQGFCYQMYKCLADAIGYGGIWNHTAYVIDPKQTYTPKLTAKITLKHDSRNKLKVTMGISTDLSATSPSYVLEFPIFKYQGGDHYMQGGTTDPDKTIEFGFDLAPLINQLNNGQPAKYFLQVQENDPSGVATGEIVSYSLIDYTSGSPVTISCSSTNVAIANNTITRLSVNHTISLSRPDITTATLPPAYLYQMYNCQLTGANGTVPYLWDARLIYPETISTATFPNVNNQQLTLTNNNTGYATLDLPFDFPYFKRSVDKLYIYADGYILFDDQPFTWPYIIDKTLLFKYTSIISPFMTDLNLYSAQSDGIWYQYDGTTVTIRWKASIYNMAGTSNLNFAVKLYKDGKIEFYYGTMSYPASTTWTGGISSGDNKNYQFTLLNNTPSVPANTLDQLTACGYPSEMQITEDGLFTGIPVHSYQNRPITFQITDNNNITGIKTLLFSTAGLLFSYTINSGGDSIIEFGETPYLNLIITNTGTQIIHNVNMWLTETDPYLQMIDSTQSLGDVGSLQTITINNAFALNVSQAVPDNYSFTLLLHLSSTEQNFQRPLDLVAWSPNINVTDITLSDGDNGRLDPGETTDMLVSFKNTGGAKASGISTAISTIDPYLTINSGTGSIGTLKPDSTSSVNFNVTVSGEAPFEHLYKINSALTANNGYTSYDTIFLFSGEIIEDFETGYFNKFPWYQGGNGLFYVDALEHYEGNYCTRSGWIYDNQESTLNLNVQVLQNGNISFYRKVSCENDPNGTNYDYLGFYIDNNEMGRWDGSVNWTKETFNVTQGYHTFKWVYHKDYSVSWGSDCVWVDFITFPPIAGAFPLISASPSAFEKSLDMGQTGDDSFIVANNGGGIMNFSALVYDTSANKGPGETDNLAGSFINCYTEGFVPGQDFAWTFAVHNNSLDNEFINHIKMDFPQGIIVNSATNFSGGSLGDLQFQGTTGNGAALNWHGTNAGRGVIKPGETATTVISGTLNEAFFNDVFVVYSIRGDSIGADPHTPSGYVKLKNFSLPNTWLTLSDNFGTLFGGQSDSVMVHFNAQNLPASSYSCNIVVKDLFNNSVVIPVVMHVLDTTSISGIYGQGKKWTTNCYPNPFSDFTRIEYGIQHQTDMKIEVYDINGHKVRTLVDKTHKPGNYSLTWDGTNDFGNPVSPGVYYCRCQSGVKNETIKIIRIR